MQSIDEERAQKLLSVGPEEIKALESRIGELEQARPREWNYGVKFLFWAINVAVISIIAPLLNHYIIDRYINPTPRIKATITVEDIAFHKDSDGYLASLKIRNIGKITSQSVQLAVSIPDGTINDITPLNFPEKNLKVLFRRDNLITFSVGPVEYSGNLSEYKIRLQADREVNWKLIKEVVSGNGRFIEEEESLSFTFLIVLSIIFIMSLIVIAEAVYNRYIRTKLRKTLDISRGLREEDTKLEQIEKMFPMNPTHIYKIGSETHLVYDVYSRRFLFWGKKIIDAEESLILILDENDTLKSIIRKKR